MRSAVLALAALLALPACDGDPAAPARPVPPVASPAPPAVAPAPAPLPADPARLLGPAEPARPAGGARGEWGEPDGAKVRKLFEAHAAEVRRCYEAELQRRPDARGKLTLRFTIAESGALRGVSVASTTFDRRRVPACVEQVVARWTTPFRPSAPVEVEYPFAFAPR